MKLSRPNNKVYIIYLIGLIFCWACPDPTPQPPENKSTPPLDSQKAEVPAPRQKPELLFSLRIHESSGAISELSLASEAEFEIEPAQRIEVLANQPLADFRVRLMDAQERVLPSDEEISLDANGTLVNIQLLSPLKPANSLVLLVDSQLAPRISNQQADTYDDFRVSLKVRGEPEKAEPKPPPLSQKAKTSKKKSSKRTIR